MQPISFLLILAAFSASAAPPQCLREFDETLCRDFDFAPELLLASATNRLTIKNATGTIIHENFSQLDKVTEIKIAGSRIDKIEPGALCCTPNLTAVTLTANSQFPKITESSLQGCHELKRITLSGPIEVSKGAFTKNRNLQSLSLNGTKIADVDATFTGLPTLSFLSIHNSVIPRIGDEAFAGLDSLSRLDLQNNKIETVGARAFGNLTQLKVLNLSDNRLKSLTWREFDGLKNLRVLFLEMNEFDRVDVDRLLTGSPNLERIFLSYDKLEPQNRKQLEERLPRANITLIYIGKPYETV